VTDTATEIPPSINVAPNPLVLYRFVLRGNLTFSSPAIISGTITITNTGPGPLAGPVTISLTQDGNAQFNLVSSPTNPCSAVTALAEGDNCSAIVVFKGCYDGTAPQATVNVLAPNAENGTQGIPIVFAQGAGQCPAGISLSPSSVAFSTCPNDNCSLPPDPVLVTVTDTGSGTLHLTNVAATPNRICTSLGACFITTPDASCGAVPPGGQCTISVAYQAGRLGLGSARSGTMVVDSNATQGEQTVPLTWPGTDIIIG
jgi:hypothetical protein